MKRSPVLALRSSLSSNEHRYDFGITSCNAGTSGRQVHGRERLRAPEEIPGIGARAGLMPRSVHDSYASFPVYTV